VGFATLFGSSAATPSANDVVVNGVALNQETPQALPAAYQTPIAPGRCVGVIGEGGGKVITTPN